jgi:transposase
VTETASAKDTSIADACPPRAISEIRLIGGDAVPASKDLLSSNDGDGDGTMARAHTTCRRLETIPGIGPVIASAIAATVPDPAEFRNGRQFAAWLGLVPRQNSTGGKARVGGLSK